MATPTNSPTGENELEVINPRTGRVHLLDPAKWSDSVYSVYCPDQPLTDLDGNVYTSEHPYMSLANPKKGEEPFSFETKHLLQTISSSMKNLGFDPNLKIYRCDQSGRIGRRINKSEYEEIDLEAGEGLPIKEKFPGPEGDLTDRRIYVTHLEEKGLNVVNSDVLIDGCNALKNYLNMKSSWDKEEWAEQTNKLETFFQNLLTGIISQETRHKASRMKKIKQKKDRRAAALSRFKLVELAREEFEKKKKAAELEAEERRKKMKESGIETTHSRRLRQAKERLERNRRCC